MIPSIKGSMTSKMRLMIFAGDGDGVGIIGMVVRGRLVSICPVPSVEVLA